MPGADRARKPTAAPLRRKRNLILIDLKPSQRVLLLIFLYVESHLGRQPTRAGTHSIKNTTTKHPERDLRIARKDFFWRRHERRRPCSYCRRSTRSLGSRQGAKDRIVFEPHEAENVTRRHRPDPSRSKSTLGQVEKAAKGITRPTLDLVCFDESAQQHNQQRSQDRLPCRSTGLSNGGNWWARRDSNPGPRDYEYPVAF